jgi:TonB-dependent SusC/RagA subfamily outer membrane receptor
MRPFVRRRSDFSRVEVAMTSLSPSALLRAGLLAALLTACAHHAKVAPPPHDASTVTADELNRTPTGTMEQALMARFPGVDVQRTPDGSLSVRIRGTTSIYGSTEPLYVLDGMAIETGPNGALNGINPYDIASIEVLKDAASTAMYGLRGANGVIIIKTKRPKEPDKSDQ